MHGKKNKAHSIRNIIVLLCCAAWMKIEGKRPLVFKSQHSNMNIIICRCCGVCKWTQKKISLGVTKCYWTFQEHFDTQVDKRGKLCELHESCCFRLKLSYFWKPWKPLKNSPDHSRCNLYKCWSSPTVKTGGHLPFNILWYQRNQAACQAAAGR